MLCLAAAFTGRASSELIAYWLLVISVFKHGFALDKSVT